MNKKQILVLGLVLGVLALGLLVKFGVRFSEDHAGKAGESNGALSRFDPVKLERVGINRGSQEPAVELAKENGVWKVKTLWNAKADVAAVNRFIEAFQALQGELRGSGKTLFKDFGMQEEDFFSIKFFGLGNAHLQDFRFGTKQAGNDGYFLRQANSQDIYLVTLNLPELLGIYGPLEESAPESLFWADRSLFNLDPEKVTELTVTSIQGGERNMKAGLQRVADAKDPLKTSWKFLRQDVASLPDSDKVLKFIVALNEARAKNIVDPNKKDHGLEAPTWELSVTANGKETRLSAGKQDEKSGAVLVKRSEDATIYDLSQSSFAELNVDDTHFLKENLPSKNAHESPLPQAKEGTKQGA